MTSNTHFYINPFPQQAALSLRYDNLDGIAIRAKSDLNKIAAVLKRNSALTSENIEQLYRVKSSLKLSIAAKNNYYQHSVAGKVSQAFQYIGRLVGFCTSVEKAKETLSLCKRLIKQSTEGLDENVLKKVKKAKLQTKLDVMHFYAEKDGQPTSQLVLKQKYHCALLTKGEKGYIVDLDRVLGKGADRAVYPATCYSIGCEPKEVAAGTTLKNLKLLTDQDYFEAFKQKTAEDTEAMQKEQELLKHLDVEGTIKPHDCISVAFPVSKTETCSTLFSMMDVYPLGDLNKFLNSDEGKKISDTQKTHLMVRLLEIFAKINQRGGIHRDVKAENILVKYNPELDLYEPTLIDFERYISLTDYDERKKTASTINYWSPEYMRAFLQPKAKKGEATTKATTAKLDIWCLGVVFYRLWHGENVLSKLGVDASKSPELVCTHAAQKWRNIDTLFLRELTPTDKLIQSMLSVDPSKRPYAQELLDQLQSAGPADV